MNFVSLIQMGLGRSRMISALKALTTGGNYNKKSLTMVIKKN